VNKVQWKKLNRPFKSLREYSCKNKCNSCVAIPRYSEVGFQVFTIYDVYLTHVTINRLIDYSKNFDNSFSKLSKNFLRQFQAINNLNQANIT
jgi:hypothetical protein